MIIITAMFLCFTLVVQAVLCVFYSKLSRQSWKSEKSEGLFYGLMAVITLMGAGFCIFAILDLLGFSL